MFCDILPPMRSFAFVLLALGVVTAQDPPSPAETSPETSPEESPAPLPTCSYRGYFSIRTNSITCGPDSKYVSYIYPRCDALRVTLLTKKQLYPKAFRAVWSMQGRSENGTDTPTSIKSYKRSNCGTRYLQDIPGTNLRVGLLDTQWTIRPLADNSADCYSNVGLYSDLENKYLAMDDSCGAFTFVEDATDPAASFSLLKLRV